MKEKKENNTKLQVILLFVFVVLAAVLFCLLDSRKNHTKQQRLQLITERYQRAYNTIYDQYKQLSENLYSGIIDRYNIQAIYQQLSTADEEQKNRLRTELFAQISPRYEELKKQGSLRLLHFHLPNNESFLRLHRPEKYGDSLTGIRETVNYVNTEHSPIDGFEEGRSSNGFRFVFPITAADQTHLGSMEVSFGPEALTSAMMKQYFVLSNFFIKEEIVKRKIFPDEIAKTYRKSHHNGYLFDKNVLAVLNDVSLKEMKELKPQKSTTDILYANAHSGRAMSFYDYTLNIVITTIPVFNPVTQEMIAFFTVRSKSSFFINEMRHFRLVFSLSLLLLIIISAFFYQQYNKRKMLENIMALLQQERDMFMQGPVMTFTLQKNENWTMEQVSANIFEILGYPAKDFLDGSVVYKTIIHPDDLQRVMDEVTANSGSENSSFTHEPYRLLKRNKEFVWVLDTTTMIRDKQGEISHYQGYLVDISQTMLMKEEILETKSRLELIIDGARLGTWDWNVVTGEVFFNERWAEIIGYSLDEIEPDLSTWEKITHPDEAEEIQRILTDHLQGRTPVYKTEHRLRHKTGRWVWVLDVGKVFEWDADGNPLRAVGIHLDITENKEAVQALIESKEQEYLQRYITAIDDIGLGLFVVDADYRVRDMNRTMTEWFGDQRGKICYESVAGLQKPCPYCCLKDVIVAGKTVKYQPTTADGRSYDVVAGPLANPEGGVSKIEIIRDITEQEQAKIKLLAINSQLEEAIFTSKEMAKKAEAANRAKSVFLSNMSHELRTPLNAILGYAQLFSGDTSLNPKQQNGIKIMHQAGEHLLMLINDILDLSKIEAGKIELVKTWLRLPEFFQGIVDIIRIRARAKKLDFFYVPEGSLPAIIETDELRLRQVILNLLSNAVKFTNCGHCTLRIQSSPAAAGKVLLTVIIEDSGVGIAPEMQEKIFEPFQQTGERLKYAEGSGLGLAISRELVLLMDGELQLVSPVNEQPAAGAGPGSRLSFAIKVPISDGSASFDLEERKVTGYTVPGEKGAPKKILLVDDNASNRVVLRDTLEPLGFVTREAEDGNEVLAACERFQPDAILMDLRMPEMDGFTATELVKGHQKFGHVPVIAITASTSNNEKLRQRCLEQGFSGYFIKPYSVSKLLKTLAEQLHIELQYAEGTIDSPKEPKILPPPQNILDNLVKLVQSGDVEAISEQSAEIAMIESGKYRAFARRIEQLVDDFQLIKIEDFITMYKKD